MKDHTLFQGEISVKLRVIHWQNLKIFFSRTTGSISTKLCTKQPWVKGIQVCSNEGPCFFQVDIVMNVRKYIFFSRLMGPILTQLGEVFTNKDHSIFKKPKEIMFFLFSNLIIAFHKCVFWFKLFLRWALWPIGLLYYICYHNLIRKIYCTSTLFFKLAENQTLKLEGSFKDSKINLFYDHLVI